MAVLRREPSLSVRPTALLGIAAIVTLLAPTPGLGQAERDSACVQVHRTIAPEIRPQDARSCSSLAVFLVDKLTASFYEDSAILGVVPPRAVQPASAGDAAAPGSLAQGEAVPGVQPIALAGGTVTAVGTDAGARAITSFAINPAVLFGKSDDAKAVAGPSRFADLTVLFPVDNLDENDDGRIDYFGIRTRVNLLGRAAGEKVLKDVEALYKQAIEKEVKLAKSIRTALQKAPADGVQPCAEALLTVKPGSTVEACGEPIAFDLEPKTYEQLKVRSRAVRDEADKNYFGLELRFDFGDPTLGATPQADATSFLAGLGWGKRLSGRASGAGLGVKLRAGARYVDLRDTSATKLGIDGGLGLEVTRGLEDQTIRLGAGLEFAYGNADKDLQERLQTDFLLFRASLSIPLVNATTATVTVTQPIQGEQSPTLSISGNWALLFSALAPASR